jgi:hypothetical protein
LLTLVLQNRSSSFPAKPLNLDVVQRTRFSIFTKRDPGYTIVTKWWWKKLLEEIKWELRDCPTTSLCLALSF